MERAVLYIHGQGGSAAEAAHYRPLFPHADVIGLAYRSQTPWEAAEEFPRLFDDLCGRYPSVTVIANSIGAYFAMGALAGKPIERAYFVSPIADMPRLIADMMTWAGVGEDDLRRQGEIETAFGQNLSWKYLTYARAHPTVWTVPTHILYGGRDHLTAPDTIRGFAAQVGATLTVMEDGEHWFHTEEQMRFLDQWIVSYEERE